MRIQELKINMDRNLITAIMELPYICVIILSRGKAKVAVPPMISLN